MLRSSSSASTSYQKPSDDSSGKRQKGQDGKELQDKNLLSSMTPAEMERFGAVGNVCEGVTSDHFKSKDLRASSLSLINANCFRHIKPEAFSGLSGEQVAALRPWDVATPEQVSKIGISAIPSLPFDKLGRYKQRSGSDAFHPCHGITEMQRVSLRLHGDAWTAYNDRCKKPVSSSNGGVHVGTVLLTCLLLFELLMY